MKIFISEKKEKGYISETDYHWCDDGDILMFGQFQTEENRKENEVGMCGILSRKFTTHILVKDLNIPKDFLLELITDSIERSMHCIVNYDGSYNVELGNGWDMKFNVNDILNELIDKASKFEDGEKVMCRGKILSSVVDNVLI